MQGPLCTHHYKSKGIIALGLILSPATQQNGTIKFHSPTSIAIYAPPYSGKSTLTRKILEHGDELFMALHPLLCTATKNGYQCLMR